MNRNVQTGCSNRWQIAIQFDSLFSLVLRERFLLSCKLSPVRHSGIIDGRHYIRLTEAKAVHAASKRWRAKERRGAGCDATNG
jgi:hypothetical protein